MRGILGLIAAAGVVLVLSSCASPGAGGLRYRDEGTVWCALSKTYDDAAFGIPLEVKSGGTITITDVTSDRSGSVKLLQTYAMPVDPDNRLGVVAWPLSKDWDSDWGRARKAAGAKVARTDGMDLVLHVKRTSMSGGELKNITIHYEQDGRQYEADTYTTARISESCG